MQSLSRVPENITAPIQGFGSPLFPGQALPLMPTMPARDSEVQSLYENIASILRYIKAKMDDMPSGAHPAEKTNQLTGLVEKNSQDVKCNREDMKEMQKQLSGDPKDMRI